MPAPQDSESRYVDGSVGKSKRVRTVHGDAEGEGAGRVADLPPTSGGVLYDARRHLHYVKPLWRGWMHLIWFEVSLVAGAVLVRAVHGAADVTAIAVYTACVSGLFGVSALYHRGNWTMAVSHLCSASTT